MASVVHTFDEEIRLNSNDFAPEVRQLLARGERAQRAEPLELVAKAMESRRDDRLCRRSAA